MNADRFLAKLVEEGFKPEVSADGKSVSLIYKTGFFLEGNTPAQALESLKDLKMLVEYDIDRITEIWKLFLI